mmetsp:Transcript_16080/g.26108  ORF Transcript_16080/g.26108 Transcript_16080/m.26108 type:complete len:249 (-) Transcript_16080:76-822(-)|eukprot:CAMPEP_0178737886 /NCGR_PEP_ID=MMETSP0744-20121128/3215_1 /TAXON_ID=913974 /ORGANISM="Nitzschia punctata, Strain CCMP561" /LENGTH=248 /DNA_ID=CAMNT_0020390461 /DNA_START=36 /DNA_END=782 /DNA_ORIENTATION=-
MMMMNCKSTVLSILFFLTPAGAVSSLRGAVVSDVEEIQRKRTICTKLADGSDHCVTNKCFTVRNDVSTYSATVIPAPSKEETGQRLLFFEGDSCTGNFMLTGVTNFKEDHIDSIVRLGLTKDMLLDSHGNKHVPYVIAKVEQQTQQNEAADDGQAIVRKLDYEGQGDYIVIVPNFVKNHGPVSELNRQCVTGEAVVGTSIVEYLDDTDKDAVANDFDSYHLEFSRLPLRTKCGASADMENPVSCVCDP